MNRALKQAFRASGDRHEALRATFDPAWLTCKALPRTPQPRSAACRPDISRRRRASRGRLRAASSAKTPAALRPGQGAARPRSSSSGLVHEPARPLFTAHHIVCDGWSTNVLLDELAQPYAAAGYGTACHAPGRHPLPRVRRAHRPRGHAHPNAAAVESWWVEKFAEPGFPARAPHRPARGPGEVVPRRAPPGGRSARPRISGSSGSVPQTRLHALRDAAGGLPGPPPPADRPDRHRRRHPGRRPVAAGRGFAGRPLRELPPAANLLRGRPDGRGFAHPGPEGAADAYEHQNYTYGSLVRKLGLRRDPEPPTARGSPVQPGAGGGRAGFPRAGSRRSIPARRVSSTSTSSSTWSSRRRAWCSTATTTATCSTATTVERWLGHYETLLEGLVGQSASARSPRLPLARRGGPAPPPVRSGTPPATEYPARQCVHQLIAEQAGPHAAGRRRGLRGTGSSPTRDLDGRPTAWPTISANAGRARGARRDLPGSFAGDADRRAGRPEGGRGLRAARPRLSRRSASRPCSEDARPTLLLTPEASRRA